MNKNCGFYSIRVTAVFTSIGLQEEQVYTVKSKVRLEVLPSDKEKVEEESSEESSNVIFMPEWTGLIEDGSDLNHVAFSKDKPIPYVAKLSQSGVLTIRWDRSV